jgi:trigger factor
MKVTLDREGKNLVKLGLELEPDKAMRAYENACRALSNKVNIPGFRRGKVPRNVLEKTVGIEYIKQETLDRLLPEVLNEAIAQESLDIITQPQIDSCKFDLGEPLKLEAKFEVRPLVTLGEYKGVTVEVPENKFEESSIDKALDSLATAQAELTTIAPRPVKMGDNVLLDFECLVDNQPVEGGKAQGMLLEVKPGGFIEGFCEQLVGKQPDSEIDINASFPADYRNTLLAGKKGVFKTKIRELREKTLPKIDDALAQKFGVESLEKLKERLATNLKEEFEMNNEAAKQKLVVEAIVKNASVDLPETMIEREQKLLLDQLKYYFQQNGRSFDDVEKSPEFEKLKTEKYEEATKRVLTSLVLGAIIKEEKITVTEEEMRLHLEEFIARMGLPPEKAAHNEAVHRQALEELLTAKVMELLLQNTQITYIPAAASTKDEKSSSTEN